MREQASKITALLYELTREWKEYQHKQNEESKQILNRLNSLESYMSTQADKNQCLVDIFQQASDILKGE